MNRLLVSSFAFGTFAFAATTLAQAPVLTRPAKPAERSAAIMSIQAQLNAFRRGDYKTAIAYQSSGLKKAFPSPDAFKAMMLNTYPEFAHSKSVTFGPAKADKTGSHLAIPAAVTGQDGITVHSVYLMVREGKVYRIEGVGGGAQPPLDTDSGPAKDV